jgi:hypothetical protein
LCLSLKVAAESFRFHYLKYVGLTIRKTVQPRAGSEAIFSLLKPNEAAALALLLEHLESLPLLDYKHGRTVEAPTSHPAARL